MSNRTCNGARNAGEPPGGTTTGAPWAADRRAAAEMPNVYVVDTAAIPRNAVDYIHLGPEGQLQLGKSLGDAFLRVAKK